MSAYGPRRATLERRVLALQTSLLESEREAKREAARLFEDLVDRKHKDRLPVRGHFVYVLRTDDDRPLYVGQTGHLLQRMGWHYRNHGQRIATVQVLECKSRASALEIEDALIWALNPPHNRTLASYAEAPTQRRRIPARQENGWTPAPEEDAA